MDLSSIFTSKATQLFWERLEDSQIAEARTSQVIENGEAYFVIRLKEMYVGFGRKLWRKYYPMLHGFTKHGQSEEHTVAGPGQLHELGEANLDRIVNLNQRLAGPTPFNGDDVALLVGLYAIPGEDAAKALIGTVATLANLGGITVGQAIPIAAAVKSGIESILGLNDAQLQLGIRDSFYAGNVLRTGFYVGIGADRGAVNSRELWLRNGRLVKGRDPNVGRPYQDHDYMVLEIERRDTRDDWPSLPGMADFQERSSKIMADAALRAPDKKKRLGELWPFFQTILSNSPYLTQPDRARIALNVSQDLQRRLIAQKTGNPFETKSLTGDGAGIIPSNHFDLLEVLDYFEVDSDATRRRAVTALNGDPFSG